MTMVRIVVAYAGPASAMIAPPSREPRAAEVIRRSTRRSYSRRSYESRRPPPHRDEQHLTTAYARALSPQGWEAVTGWLPEVPGPWVKLLL